MAFEDDIILTYDDTTRIPDVQAAIIELTPTKTPLYSGLRKTYAKDTVHSWQEESYEVAQDNAAIEGSAFGDPHHPMQMPRQRFLGL